MRYKALSVSVRGQRPPTIREPRRRSGQPSARLRDWLASAIMIALALALVVPMLTTKASAPSLTIDPAQVVVGSTVTVIGQGFEPKTRGQLTVDGATTGLPRFRVDTSGSFTEHFKIRPTANGPHKLSAMSLAVGKVATGARAGVLLAFVVFVVGPAAPATPDATASGVATASPIPSGTTPPIAAATATPSPSGTSSSATATATPAAVGSDLQPVFPIRAGFYYPWYPQAWNQQGMTPFTKYHPSLGFYDGASSTVVRQQIAAMQYGRIQAGIASWWGQGSRTDTRMPMLLSAATGSSFRWSIYYEAEGSGNPSVSQIRSDLEYLKSRYGNDPSYLRVGGRFVVFVYGEASDGCATADRWRQANAVDAYVVLKVFSGYGNCANQPDGWHQYAPAKATDSQGSFSYAISPGFYKANESSARLSRDLSRWTSNVRAMAASGARFQLITTFNEWGEGTSVESATQWASASGYGSYLDVLHANGSARIAVAPVPGPTPAPTPQPTPAPTARPPAAPSGSDPVLVGAGDIASCSSSGDEATARLLDRIGGTVFTAGDTVYNSGTAAEFANCYNPSWGRFRSRTKPAPGNHDYLTANASAYFAYFGGAAGDPTKGYYAYDLGSWRIYALNSNCSKIGGCSTGSPQQRWLAADLAAHPMSCVAAYWHHPRFSSGEHGDQISMQPIWQTLYEAAAEIVIGGHDHDYERFAPQSASGGRDDARGIRQFVVGTGGKNHYGLSTPDANSQVRNATTFGVLKLTLHARSYTWQFVPEAGKTFTDSGTTNCH